LDVSVDATGAIQKIVSVRDVPPLTNAARTAVNTWKFTPAMKGAQRVPGVVRVDVVFNPFNPGGVSIPYKPLPPPETGKSRTGVFQPPNIKAANYALYPVNTVASGTVVLDVKVGADGSMQGVGVLGGEGGSPLTGMATRAVHNWSFTPATYEGQPIVAHTIVAFVFPSPA
jgi:TonB family protein